MNFIRLVERILNHSRSGRFYVGTKNWFSGIGSHVNFSPRIREGIFKRDEVDLLDELRCLMLISVG